MHVYVRINYDRCRGCGDCVKSCRFGVLEMLDEMPIVVDASQCKACMDCVEQCKAEAIDIIVR